MPGGYSFTVSWSIGTIWGTQGFVSQGEYNGTSITGDRVAADRRTPNKKQQRMHASRSNRGGELLHCAPPQRAPTCARGRSQPESGPQKRQEGAPRPLGTPAQRHARVAGAVVRVFCASLTVSPNSRTNQPSSVEVSHVQQRAREHDIAVMAGVITSLSHRVVKAVPVVLHPPTGEPLPRPGVSLPKELLY